ncbi:hypothetical protein XA68_13399 [Ophiocordyceps unilateralis]|uniref:Carrier domain-containing protein n=1 Tax=Ophiocordyceps unilateralis TaxID=268505 RepID=A0A2A9PCW1_OPHUN|nr:hypothetical protein XA68_13399 [Ophiocordyceps unilateralis]
METKSNWSYETNGNGNAGDYHEPMCVDLVIKQRARDQPGAVAVCAWDGQLSYAELDDLSTAMAIHLAKGGVKPEAYVPIYSEKSVWVPVAALAVLKAGGAFVLLDISYPASRLETICHTVGATIVVASEKTTDKAKKLAAKVVVTGIYDNVDDGSIQRAKPSNAAYAIFTSGTSGKPKGVTIEHQAFCSSAFEHAKALDMNASSRVLQFASYAFDACLTEMLAALMVGACVCIPSEQDRVFRVRDHVRQLHVTWALLTPSVSRVLDVSDLAGVRTLVLGGEAVQVDDITKWTPHLDLFIAYGLTECAVVNMVHPCRQGDVDAANLGHGVGVDCWVAQQDNHGRLVQAGHVGELLLSGPSIGRGYIDDPVRTADAFITKTPWYSGSSRIYKTGDLVICDPIDGTIRYVGRKDTQAKLYGQRFEAAEIEHHIRRQLPASQHIVVQVAQIDESETLVALVSPAAANSPAQDDWLLDPTDEFRHQARMTQRALRNVIPSWMVPSVFLPLGRMPLTASGKCDRRQLSCWIASLSRTQLQTYALSRPTGAKHKAESPTEKVVRELWAQILQIEAGNIVRQDSFFDLGGSSIDALKLASAARKQGLDLALDCLYGNDSLAAMAASVQPASQSTIQPFSLVEEREPVTERVTELCQLMDTSDLEDVYPCTPLQEELLSLTAKRPGAYRVAFEYDLPDDVDASRFKRAWDAVVEANPILRTRFVQTSTGAMYQAVIHGSLPWSSRHEALSTWDGGALGRPLIRFCLEPVDGRYQFTLVLHHALSDGWALQLILRQAQEAYDGATLTPRPFAAFIEYVGKSQTEECESFWKGQFADLEAATFPSLSSAAYIPNLIRKETVTMPVESATYRQFAIPNRLTLAWGILITLYTDSLDAVFGVTVTGRGAPVLGVDEMTGPTIATVPCRLRLSPDMTIEDGLSQVQRNRFAATPFEQAGLQRISRMSADANSACRFQSLLVIQPRQDGRPPLFQSVRDLAAVDAFSSYAITLICWQMGDSVQVEATFDAGVVDETQMRRMLHQLRHIFLQLRPSERQLRIKDVDVTSAEDWAELAKWNQTVCEPVRACAHDLVSEQVQRQPDAPAVCAWDGDFTYRQMEDLSSRLAAHLVAEGVEAGVFVPLCFEKSRWVAVAMLAVLKAGGAFVLLDPSYPTERLRTMCRDCSATLIVTSSQQATLARSLTSRAIIVATHGEQRWKEEPATPSRLPALFILIFRGFAAYAFDISIADHLLTLVAGGCICIPSQQDIEGRISEAITRLGANWACLTPSVARVIDPANTPSLRRLVLCGEPLPGHIVSLWSPYAHLLNLYGPAECAILTTLHRDVRDATDPNNIAFPTSAVCWVVDAQNAYRLAPLGTVGELLVESPIVGHGYLNDGERTAESFIAPDQRPRWLRRFRAGQNSRLYLTGDLVQYTKDGSLRYIGRKDTQIKLRGQRVELGEVEHHLRRCFPGAQDAIAEIVVRRPGNQAAALTAFILPEQTIFKIPDKLFLARAAETRGRLELAVPPYMVPAVFIPVNQFPYSTSGKLDRKLLRSLAADLSLDEYSKSQQSQSQELSSSEVSAPQTQAYSSNDETVKRAPSTDVEQTIHAIWARVLDIDSESFGVEDNFFRLGGDSIGAMRVVAQCATAGLRSSVAALFKAKTIAQMSLTIEKIHSTISIPAERLEKRFSLSPIQQLFFDNADGDLNHFNQSLSFRVPHSVSSQAIQEAIEWIVAHHSMLRARFVQEANGHWEQYISRDAASSLLYEDDRARTRQEAASLIEADQRKLDILRGPLLVAHVLSIIDVDELHLSLTVHHLVMDNVSWKILLADLEHLLASQGPPALPPLSFQAWCQLQAAYTKKHTETIEVLPRNALTLNVHEYWRVDTDDNCWGNTLEQGFNLGEQETQTLVGDAANKAFGTQPVEILHAALLQAFLQTFKDRPSPIIFSEGHGREPWDASIDPTGTIGWFTTIWPAHIPVEPTDTVLEIVRKTKDARRQIKSNGWAYFTSRQLVGPKPDGPIEILFNYHPGFTGGSKGLLQPSSLVDGQLFQMSPSMPRFALINVMAEVADSRLSLSFIFNKRMQSSMSKWITQTQSCLEAAASLLVDRAAALTLSDFPLLSYSYPELDAFSTNILAAMGASADNIEYVYPCSPIQEGMLLSQAKVSSHYLNRAFWVLRSRGNGPVREEQLRTAWLRVVQKHPLLRTVIFRSPRDDGHHDQLVLREPPDGMCVVLPACEDPLQRLKDHQFDTPELSPPHRFAICSSHHGDVMCLLEISHALVDGFSRQLLLRDLCSAYDGPLVRNHAVGTYRDYVEYLESIPREDAIIFWQSYLKSVQPCNLPPTPPRQPFNDTKRVHNFKLSSDHALHHFCAQQELTLGNVLQLAWALVLRLYVGAESVCFGYMSAGRDVPVPGVDEIVGPLINILIFRLPIDGGESLLDLLRQNQADFVQCLKYQHLLTADKMKAAEKSDSKLFNTIMSVQREIEPRRDDSSVEFGELGGEDPTEYDVILNIGLLEQEVNVSLQYRLAFISDEQIENMADAFQQALLDIVAEPSQTARTMSLFGALSYQRVTEYNRHELVPVNDFIDELIASRCRAQPLALAIDACDGKITYGELDDYSSLVAAELAQRDIGPNRFVALCFEKSLWTTVALLGVLKAGAAFILLDPSHPQERLQSICRDAIVAIVLTSNSNRSLAAQLASETLDVGKQIVSWKMKATPPNRGSRDPSDVAYLIFTSGSTGKPKGVMVQHDGLATSALSHGSAFLMNTSSRVLQFASYAFDASIVDQITTLIFGGCICIPSDVQRQDIAKSAAAYEANWVSLTPSVARALDPADFQTLQTLVCGGESFNDKVMSAWFPHVNFFTAYGPSECAIICSGNLITSEFDDLRNLGRFFASHAWVVSPDDPSILLPVGAVGELVVQGHIVGRGYLQDPDKTAYAFIEPPMWLSKFRNGSGGRLYRTGDMVRYVNGEVQFVGRKDSQVKLRGHRIELGEVEIHVLASFAGAVHALVEVVTPVDGGKALLVAFIQTTNESPETNHDSLFDKPSKPFALKAQSAETQMTKSLPIYMIPVLFLPLRWMPLTGTGKADRNRLRSAAARLSAQELEQYAFSTRPNVMPSTKDEALLQKVWARVLNKDLASVGIHHNFFRLGGDSISAMQVTSRCAAAGLRVTVADIFRHKTIAQLAAGMEKSSALDLPSEKVDCPFELSPIQKLVFRVAPLGKHHFNMGFFLRIAHMIPSDHLDDALHQLVQQHSMLRARFSQSQDGHWVQSISADAPGSYRFRACDIDTMDQAGEIISESELAVDIQHGPILAVDLINVGSQNQFLFIVAHHLVTDLVSWRILLADLEDYLTRGSISKPSLPFQTWCHLQAEYAARHLDPEHARLDNGAAPPPADYWGIARQSNSVKDTAQTAFTIDQATTIGLFGAANEAFRTRPVELFQAALLFSFAQVFRDRSAPVLWNEGHGREPWTRQLDLSRTVGWFTTLWPVAVEADGLSLFDVVRRTKDKCRSSPDNGWAHFTSSLHHNARHIDVREITFNFIGRFQQLEREESLFMAHPRPPSRISDISEELGRLSVIDVTADVRDDCLGFQFHYNKYAADNRPILDWIIECKRTLVRMAGELPERPAEHTLKDFPLLPFTYDSLDSFLVHTLPSYGVSPANVEDAYPCSPIQRGILLSYAKQARHYQTFLVFKVKPQNGSEAVSLDRVVASWQRIVSRHAIFRTVFVESISQDNWLDQVVLKKVSAHVNILSPDEEARMMTALSDDRQLAVTRGQLPYRMTMGQTVTGDVLCGLEMSHSLFDGASRQNLLAELALAYDGPLSCVPGPAYRDYIAYLESRPVKSHQQYWAKYLEGVVPCQIPATPDIRINSAEDTLGSIHIHLGDMSALRQFCQSNELTLSNVFQVVWGVVLRAYTNSDDVCFGYLSSGRDVPVPQAHEMIGPLINMLVCRMQIDDSQSLRETLEAGQDSFAESLKHQHYPLAEMLRAANISGGRSLFNTVMSLQTMGRTKSNDTSSVRVDVVGGEDASEYNMTIHVLVEVDGIDILLEYWRSSLSDDQANQVAETLRQVVLQVVDKADNSIGDIELVSKTSLDTLTQWSGTLPPPEYTLVHDLIHEQCLAQPEAPAVDAWDGTFTYREVDELSSKLANHLAHFRLAPDSFIPICFEKSRWTTVAMMAVMKTGCAFIPLDPSQPVQRLQDICQGAQVSALVASKEQARIAACLAKHVVTVGDDDQDWRETDPGHQLESFSPRNLLYAIFTSGSTGKPKGVMIEHCAFSSSAKAHSKALNITKDSRVLQFASYAFDASVSETLTTLLKGGCVCVPSDEERKISLAAVVSRTQANWMFMTPAVARVLNPDDFPSIKTMLCGGEVVSETELMLWRDAVDLRLVYGPTECAVYCSATNQVTAETSARNLGRPFGCRSWVVKPHNHQKPVPIGAVGELLIEGPIVSRGYLDDSERTASVFIDQPEFLKTLGDTPSAIYKTGDLVKYNADGSLEYVSRKDTQVKLRGQRIELGEVEQRARQCFPRSTDVVVELVESMGPSRHPALVALIHTAAELPTKGQDILAEPSSSFRQEAQAAETALTEMLPSYMVPSFYLPVHRMPLSNNGKVDRRLLRQLASTLSDGQVTAYSTSLGGSKLQPTSDVERRLRAVWARILNLEPEAIGIDDSFFRIGGDSISAMQVVTQCANERLQLTMADFFRYKTISAISQQTTCSVAPTQDIEVQYESPFDLSPIQQMFFETAPDGVKYFNQSFFLRLNTDIDSAVLRDAMTQLVTRHHMLRARFRKTVNDTSRIGGCMWQQLISDTVDGAFRYQEHQVAHLEESRLILVTAQTLLDMQHGPVFSADLVNVASGGQYLFMVAHHLVVDLVSWRIIIRDLEDLLKTRSIVSPPSISFQAWCRLQSDYALEHLTPDCPLAVQVPAPMLDYWGLSTGNNLVSDIVEKELVLGEQVTRTLLGTANDAFQSRPVELLQAALIHSFALTFQDRPLPAIFSEGHGREAWDSSINLNSTVGWFTTLSPTVIESTDLLEAVRQTKDQRRRLRDNGWAYFTSRYLGSADRLSLKTPLEIVFNFTGSYQQLERSDALFSLATEFRPSVPDISQDSPRFALFDVSATVSNNRLRLSFFYNHRAADVRPVDLWISNYAKTLERLSSTLPSQPLTYTLADFPLLRCSYAALDRFVEETIPRCQLSMDQVEDVYPCSPIQNGMLLSQTRSTAVYYNRFLFRVKPNSGTGNVCEKRFARAWRRVVARHPILRTFFIPSLGQGSFMDQVVLQEARDDIVTMLPIAKDPLTILQNHSSGLQAQGVVPHHLTTCCSPNSELLVLLEIDHSLLDGTSLQILVRDLQSAYDDSLPAQAAMPYKDYIAYVQSIPTEEAKQYWMRYLEGSNPCLFPSMSTNSEYPKWQSAVAQLGASSDLTRFCEANHLTLSNVVQVAWGLVLRAFTGSDDVCFGYLTSGRDIPLPGVEEALGPLINMLVCRIDFSNGSTMADLLQRAQEDHVQNSRHQHLSLAEIKGSLQLPDIPLFNTIVSLQRSGMVRAVESKRSVAIEPVQGKDPTEYDMTVNVWVHEDSIKLVLNYWTSFTTAGQAATVLDTLSQAISEIRLKVSQRAADMNLLGPRSRQQVWQWNQRVPARIDRCAHDLIRERNLERAEEPAVCAWNGDFSHGELDQKASQVAAHLVREHGVEPGVFVPVYFEKSRWTIVAILAILKSGGAFVLMDPSHPAQRLSEICRDVGAAIVVTSESKATDAAELGPQVIVIGDGEFAWKEAEPLNELRARPSDPIYAVFTSGSTGKPKGAIMTHAAWCTSAEANRIGLFVESRSRVLQFASYAFDISIADMLLTLLAGGCVCVPSDEDRQSDLMGAINNLEANWACLTPSITRIIEPGMVPSVHTLVLCGEAVAPGDIAKWKPHVHLLNLYGPAECAILTTLNRFVHDEKDANNVGYPTSAVCWVVDPDDYEKLVPVGQVGELVVEGPIVGREYIGNPSQSAASFLPCPLWLRQFRPSAAGPIYRTGDLVQYVEDGSLRSIGRKDTQVKVRGQRVELGEVEHHLRQSFPDAQYTVAEVIQTGGRPSLAAFIYTGGPEADESDDDNIFRAPDDHFNMAASKAVSHLQRVLPVFMVPTSFIALARAPLTKTGKMDRRTLRAAAANLTRERFAQTNLIRKRAPRTQREGQLRSLCADVLGLPPSDVGIDDHFFRLGGDSILGMALIHKAREAGLAITMADIFTNPKVCDLAAASTQATPSISSSISPFALVDDADTMVQLASAQCGISATQIDDIYPCTPLQEGLVALSAKRPGHYIATFEFTLAESVDVKRFIAAWDSVVVANPILRTRVIQSDSGFLQAVVKDAVPWQSFDGPESCRKHVNATSMGLGDPLVQFALVESRAFHLTLHHALYDGASLPKLWSQAEAAYKGVSLPPRPFNSFIGHVLAARGGDFWRSEFAGFNGPVFPTLPRSRYIPDPAAALEHRIAELELESIEYTISTAIRLAWAVVLSCHADSDDILYGLTVNGRSAPLEGIEDITGPTFATFPVRTRVNQSDTVQTALAAIHQQTTAAMPFQQFGMQNMRQLSPEAAAACSFQCHVTIQPSGEYPRHGLLADVRTKHEDYGKFANYAFVPICHLPAKDESELLVTVSHDANIVHPLQARRMVQQFEHVLRQLVRQRCQSLCLGQLDLISPQDRQQLLEWNRALEKRGEREGGRGQCLHEMVLSYASSLPKAPAISAWDGDMTFSQLDAATATLARQFQSLGIQAGDFVALLFDRCRWLVITMIALHRIGAVCVNIDPTLPREHIQQLLNLSRASFVLTGPQDLAEMGFDNTTVATVPIVGAQPQPHEFSAPNVDCHDAAFVTFAWGSKGEPAGTITEHANLATWIRDNSHEARLNPGTRGLHFAPYASEASIYEIFAVLANGGCICIPSESDDIVSFINKHGINWALFTPSFLSRMSPNAIPGVGTILVSGEATATQNIDGWASHVNLVATRCGPTKTTLAPSVEKQGSLVRVTAGVGWIVVPSEPSRLVPIGAPGELVVEGQSRDSENTNPPWLGPFREGNTSSSRLYRTGHLVQYSSDGALLFLGRRDAQIKLRGQRIELGEVEHQVRRAFPGILDVVAEIISPHDGGGSAFLVAFVASGVDSMSESLFETCNAEFLAQAEAASRSMGKVVPDHMVPAIFVRLSAMPRDKHGKADRGRLLMEASKLSQHQLQALFRHVDVDIKRRKPETAQEILLQTLWAQVLTMAPDDIGLDDDFFNLRGDSISAMKLAGLARRHGKLLPVSRIFKFPVLSEQAAMMETSNVHDPEDEYRPGSLLGITDVSAFFDDQLGAQARAYRGQDVEDVLPTTETQASFLRNKNLTHTRLHLSTEIDADRLDAACRALVRKHAILRTVFVVHDDGILQVVLRDVQVPLLRLECSEDLWQYSEKLYEQDASSPVPFGSLHFQPILVSRSESEHMLILRMTHAQYDGGSMPMLSQDLALAYDGHELAERPPFAHFLRYRQRQDTTQTREFWRAHLLGSEMTDYRVLCKAPPAVSKEHESVVKPLRETALPSPPPGVTMASLVKAAWSVVLARAAGKTDIVFGHLINGRDALLQGIHDISGPCITMSPFRVVLEESWTWMDLLGHVQAQYLESMPFSHSDLAKIRRHCTAWPADTHFGSVVTHQDANIDLTGSINGSPPSIWRNLNLGIHYDFHVVTTPVEDRLLVQFSVSSAKINQDDADTTIDEFCRIMAEISADPTRPIQL